MITQEQIWFELCKLALQAGGAIFVARLAVRWALARYKEEKTWERQLAAYVDVCTALGDMRLIIGKWADQEEGVVNYSEDFQSRMGERYHAAKKNMENTVAVASLILPRETHNLLHQLEIDLEKVKCPEDRYEEYNAKYLLIDDALVALTKQGRQALGFPVHALDKKAWRKTQRKLEEILKD